MTTKEYLNQAYILDRRIRQIERVRERIRADLYSLKSPTGSMSSDKVQMSMAGDKLERLIARVSELEAELLEERAEMLSRKEMIFKQIRQVGNQKHKELLIERYINFQKWTDIAAIMGYKDVRNIYRLHGRALKSFEKVLRK